MANLIKAAVDGGIDNTTTLVATKEIPQKKTTAQTKPLNKVAPPTKILTQNYDISKKLYNQTEVLAKYVGGIVLEKKQIKANSVEALLNQLAKDYGSDWYQKVKITFIKDSPFEVIVEVSEIGSEGFEQQTKESIHKDKPNIAIPVLPDISEIERKHSEPRVMVWISEDKMIASISVIPGLRRIVPTVDEVVEALNNAGVKYGINRERIEQIIREQRFFTSIPVASGKPPKSAKDAQIQFLFPLSGYVSAKPDESERIDPASLYKIFTCEKDQLLALKVPSVEGEDGFTVTGETIKVEKAKDINLKNYLGENVYLSEDGNKIFASCAGQPFFKNSMVHVKQVFVVEGDLNYTVGNINFNGTVIIRGNAEGPFKISAKGDVVIEGILGEVQVSSEGSLMVKGGIFGRSKGIVKVRRDLFAKFVNEARIFCEGKVLIEDYIMNSILVCNSDVFVGGRGIIVGGIVKARGNITAKELGTKTGIKTLVSCGINYEIEEKYEQCELTVSQIVKEITKISENEQRIKGKLLQTRDLKQREMLRNSLFDLERQRQALLKQLFRLKQAMEIILRIRRFENISTTSRIILRGVCHPNVKITIGYETFHVKEQMTAKEFYIDKDTGKITWQ